MTSKEYNRLYSIEQYIDSAIIDLVPFEKTLSPLLKIPMEKLRQSRTRIREVREGREGRE